MRPTQPITTKLGSYIPPAQAYYLIRFWRNSFFFFFKGQTLNWVYLMNGWSNCRETIRRCIGRILGKPCDLDLWLHPWPWPLIFKVKSQDSCISRIVIWLIWNKKKANQLDTWLIVTWDERDVSRSFMTMTMTLWATMVGWVDVPHSDWGDFKRRRAVDISSYSNDIFWKESRLSSRFKDILLIEINGPKIML